MQNKQISSQNSVCRCQQNCYISFLYFRKLLNKVNKNKRIITIKPNKRLSTKSNKAFCMQTKDGFFR